VNGATKKCRAFSVTMVVAIALLFGLLSSAQCTRMLFSLSRPRVCSLANPGLGLTRHAIKEVSPSKPELPAISALTAQWLPGVDTPQAYSLPMVSEADAWPESGRIQHRRIPSRSPDDSESL
jgi:hypothetical protein